MSGLRPIQTQYRGYMFRSRLEARWAVAFDHMGLKWEYEPEGFVLPSGRMYLPDFRLHMPGPLDLWVEIKPANGDISLFEEFIENKTDGCYGTVFHDIPDPLEMRDDCSPYWYGQRSDEPHLWASKGGRFKCEETGYDAGGWADNHYIFCACRKCNVVGFEFDGRAARIPCACPTTTYDGKDYQGNHPRILRAFAAARAARFEHEHREVWA